MNIHSTIFLVVGCSLLVTGIPVPQDQGSPFDQGSVQQGRGMFSGANNPVAGIGGFFSAIPNVITNLAGGAVGSVFCILSAGGVCTNPIFGDKDHAIYNSGDASMQMQMQYSYDPNNPGGGGGGGGGGYPPQGYPQQGYPQQDPQQAYDPNLAYGRRR